MHSSSSSSIGKEENANFALNGYTRGHKLKNQFMQETPRDEVKSKLDFAGQQVVVPQPQEQSDDSLIDHYTVELHTPVLNKVRVSI